MLARSGQQQEQASMFGSNALFQRRHEERSSSENRGNLSQPPPNHQEQLWREANEYIRLFHQECGFSEQTPRRLAEIQAEIVRTGTYWQTPEELTYGARVAWRNNTRCIGRLHWQHLVVRDLRHLTTADEIFAALLEHLQFATNGGKIRSTISVFAPASPGEVGLRIWNPQLIRYAGYRQSDGTIVGDPLHADLTDVLRQMGWRCGTGTPFDILPLVIQLPGRPPQIFELPENLVLEVPLTHPDYPWFADLGLKWHALPLISNMRMEIGGISYTCAPFNGWYMGTEIGARNLGDVDRYNLLPVVAQKMGLDTGSDRTLWKDRALVELNVAVLSSFAQHKVTIVDHHTASRQFLVHDEKEIRCGRSVPAHWTWLVPPISGSASPIFHKTTYKNLKTKPNFFYQPNPWQQPNMSAETQLPYQHPLTTPEQRSGTAAPHMAQNLNNLASLCKSQGRYAEAEQHYYSALTIYEQHLGAYHPDIAQCLNNLAHLYYIQGNYLKAEPLIKCSLRILERTLGSEHPKTQAVQQSYFFLLRTMGRDRETGVLARD